MLYNPEPFQIRNLQFFIDHPDAKVVVDLGFSGEMWANFPGFPERTGPEGVHFKQAPDQNPKAQLEKILQKPLLSFAYPYGALNESAKEQAILAGYRFAVATDSGPLGMHEDRFQIRRIVVFPRTDTFGLWRKIRGNYVFRRAH